MADAAALERYGEEQARLQRERETGSKDDLHIEPPKPPDVNPEVYRDVEPILFQGFVYVAVEINEVSFVFKSLNQHEFNVLHLVTDPGSYRGRQRFYDMFLAYGVLMVDGVNVLPDRSHWLPELAKMFHELDEGARQKVIRHLSEINRRANRAVILSEVYSQEGVSRLRWGQYHGLDLTSPAVTGFAGTEHLGLNWGQLIWRALNHYEDVRDQAEREWENAKFVASAMAGSKGMSGVNSQDKQRREKERNEKLERRDKVLRAAVLGEGLDGKDPKKGAPMTVARTVEELADQLEKDLKGEKDWHDEVVEAHERQARGQYHERMQRLRDMRQAHIDRFGTQPVVGGSSFEGLTPDQVQKRIQERQQRTVKKLAAAQQQYPEAFDPKLGQFMDKWSGARSAGGQEPAPPLKLVPFKRGQESED